MDAGKSLEVKLESNWEFKRKNDGIMKQKKKNWDMAEEMNKCKKKIS